MKNTAKLFLLALTVSLVSCSKSNDDNANPSSKTDQVSGNWTVSYYFDSGKDETHKYNGYTFAFNTGGVLQANSSASTFTGTWRIGDSSGDDDSSSNKLVIMITGDNAMDDLEDDWLIVKLTDNEIWLKDDNPTKIEELRFGR